MGKRGRTKSPGPFHGYSRVRSGSYNALESGKARAKPRTRSYSTNTIRSRLRSQNIVQSPDNSNDSFINGSSHEALSAINSYVSELESALTELERSLPTPGVRNRPLLSSTRDDLTDELNCDELLITAIRVIVLDPEDSVIQDKVFVESRLQDLGDRTYPVGVSTAPELQQLRIVDGGDLFNRQLSLALNCSIPSSPEVDVWEPEQPELIAADSVESPADLQVIPDSAEHPAELALLPVPVIQVTMSAGDSPSAVERAADRYVEAVLIWEQDYLRAEFKDLPISVVQQLAEQAVSQQKELRAAYLAVRKLPAEDLGEIESLQHITDLTSKFVQFRDRAYAVLAANPTAADAKNDSSHNTTVLSHMSAATEECISKSVNSRKDGMISNGKNVAGKLLDLVDVRPETTQGFIELESKLEAIKLEAKDAVDALKELAAAATSVGNSDAAMLLIETTDKLISSRTKAVTSVKAAKVALGIPEGGASRQVHVSIKAPVFKGDFKEQMDYFSFEKSLNEYFDSIGSFSFENKLNKLRNDCLVGAAKDAVVTARTYQEAMAQLNQHYAKPAILLALKTKEIMELGPCPEALLAKRGWFINVFNKFNYVQTLAEEHGEEDFMVGSDLAHQITVYLSRYDRYEFENVIKKANRRSGGVRITKAIIASKLSEFLQDQIEDLGGMLDYKITNGYTNATEMMKSLQLDGKKPYKQPIAVQGSNGRKGAYPVQLSCEQPSLTDSSQSEPEEPAAVYSNTQQPPKKLKKKRGRNKQAGSNPEEVSSTVLTAFDPLEPPATSIVMVNKSKQPMKVLCRLCNTEHESLAYCVNYREANVSDRWIIVLKTNSCYRCLRSDAGFELKRRDDWFAEHQPYCSDRFVCKHGWCASNSPVKQNHVTVCKHHLQENKDDHAAFLASLDLNRITTSKKFFYWAAPHVYSTQERKDGMLETDFNKAQSPIYMLQYIPVYDSGLTQKKLLAFYDSGCMEAVMNDRAYAALKTTQVKAGPISLDVAGGKTLLNPYGYEKFSLEMCNGSKADITALHMVEVTSPLPVWTLSQAWNDVRDAYLNDGGVVSEVPTCPDEIGGASVDIMLGVEFMAAYPDLVFELPGGLRLYRSKIKAPEGHRGILGGPHHAWTKALSAAHSLGPHVYFTSEARAMASIHLTLKTNFKMNVPCAPDDLDLAPLRQARLQCIECGCWEESLFDDDDISENAVVHASYQAIASDLRKFEDRENIGASIDYRCTVCRNCSACRKSDQLETLSLQEEIEQKMIEDCVRLDVEKKTVFSTLPFIKDPDTHLTTNRRVAEKILDTQLKIIHKNDGMKESVIKAHDKLVNNGHVVKLEELPENVQIACKKGGYTIPWRPVFNAGSLTSATRMVFDASSRTPQGSSLNEILAKGQNKLGQLVHLLIRFRYGCSAFSSDITMAYNNLKLDPKYFRFQQYLWKEDLNTAAKIIVMIVITLIYGVRPAGNLTMAGFMKIVEHAKELGGSYLPGAEALENRSYMDDIFGAYFSAADRNAAATSLEKTLKLGSMALKAIIVSGENPPEEVTADGTSVGVVGYRWHTKDDLLTLAIKPTTLQKSKRGRPAPTVEGDLKDALAVRFTKRVLAGRVAAVYDPLGLASPLTSQLKLDMSCVCKLVAGWDDFLPSEMLGTWVNNLDQIQELDKISVPRNVGCAEEGVKKFELIGCADASQQIAAAAIYARTKNSNGTYDCNLLIAKTKLVTKSTIPRAELRAATLVASLAHVVRHNLGEYIEKEYFITDSTITLCWMNQDSRPLQLAIRNSVIEIRRLTNLDDWYHCPGLLNPADIPTRQVKVSEFVGNSCWFKGMPWMRGPEEDMPLKSVNELKLSAEELVLAGEGCHSKDVRGMVLTCKVSRLTDRYKFSKYLLDPCSRSWPNYLRRLAIVFKCIRIWRKTKKAPKLNIIGKSVAFQLNKEDWQDAENYLFRTTSRETKYFNDKPNYQSISYEKDGILRYSGRILDGDKPESVPGAMLDLGSLHFCTPLVDRYSPVAYAVMLYVHQKLTHHGGAISCLRRSWEIVHILKGKSLAEEIREMCVFCQRYKQRMVQAELGKIHPTRFTPAPPFHFCQVDLAGPWSARCEHKPHRDTVKVWAAVYKCTTTLAVWVEALPAYDAATFIDSYIRFNARFGHVGVMFIDPGSQLMSACQKMEFSYADLERGIEEKGVTIEHQVCPTGSHESQGQVERSIKEIRRVFDAVFKGFGLSIMQYETAFAYISSSLNDIPLCLGNKYTGLDHLDLITPNRLLMGRNHARSPVGLVTSTTAHEWIASMEEVGLSWWKLWEQEWLMNLVPKVAKFPEGDPDIAVGDVVIFMKDGKEAAVGQTPWRTGKVEEIHISRDGIIRSVDLKYQNYPEKVYRYTHRSVRTIAKIYREGDINLMGELSEASRQANIHFLTTSRVVT